MATYLLTINVAITSSSVANPSVITTPSSHGFATGASVTISGHTGSTPSINGTHTVTRISATQFSIPVNVTVGGTGGKAVAARNFLLGSASISEVLNGRHSMRVDIYSDDAAYRPKEGAEIILYEDGTAIFGGFIQRATEKWAGDGQWLDITTQVEAVAYTSLADRFYVDETFASGTTMEAMLNELQTSYFAQYGLTIDPSQATGYTTTAEVKYLGARGTDVLNQLMQLSIADGTPFFWYIGHDKVWGAKEIGTLAAPFNIADGDSNVRGDLVVEHSREQKPNRVHAVLGTDKLVDLVDNFTGDGVTNAFVLTEKIRGPLWFEGLTDSAVGYAFLYYNSPSTESIGGSTASTIWRYTDSTKTLVRNIGGAPANGVAISVPYQAQFPITVTVENTADITANGLWEERVAFPDCYSRALGTELADARLLSNTSSDTVIVKYRTLSIGIRPGMTQSIVNTKRNVNGSFLVIDVNTKCDTKANLFWREVTAIQGDTTKLGWRDVYISWLGGGVGSKSTSTVPVSGSLPGFLGPAAPNRSIQFNKDYKFGGSEYGLFDWNQSGDEYNFAENLKARAAFGVDDEDFYALALWNSVAGKSKALTFRGYNSGEWWIACDPNTGSGHFFIANYDAGKILGLDSDIVQLSPGTPASTAYGDMRNLWAMDTLSARRHDFSADHTVSTTAMRTLYRFTGSSNATLSLPAASAFSAHPTNGSANYSRLIGIVNTGTAFVTVDADGSDTFYGSAAALIVGPGQAAWVASDGVSAWLTVHKTVGPVQVTLTNAQVKALPTTQVNILPTPPTGYRINAFRIDLFADFSAGAYTNINAAAYIWAEGPEAFSYIANDAGGSPALTYATVFLDGTDKTCTLLPWQDTNTPTLGWGLLSGVFTTFTGYSTALYLKANNGGSGDFTGGNAANTLRARAWYDVVAA